MNVDPSRCEFKEYVGCRDSIAVREEYFHKVCNYMILPNIFHDSNSTSKYYTEVLCCFNVIQIKYGLPYYVTCPSMSTDPGIRTNTGSGDTVLAKHT